MIIKDYETFHQEIEELQQENLQLKNSLKKQAKTAGAVQYDQL